MRQSLTQKKIEIKLQFDRKNHSSSIAQCSIVGNSGTILGHISRVSGHFCPLQSSIRSFQPVLGPDLYSYLRHAVLQWIEVLFEQGEIEEEELFSVPEMKIEPDVAAAFDAQEPAVVRSEEDAEPLHNEATTAEVDRDAVGEDMGAQPEAAQEFLQELVPADAPAINLLSETAEPTVQLPVDTHPVVRVSKIKPTFRLPKHIRYRDVLSALQRTGVSMRSGASHTYVLSYGDRTATMYNPHTIDPAENRRILQRILRELGIEDEFIQNLSQRGAKNQRRK